MSMLCDKFVISGIEDESYDTLYIHPLFHKTALPAAATTAPSVSTVSATTFTKQ